MEKTYIFAKIKFSVSRFTVSDIRNRKLGTSIINEQSEISNSRSNYFNTLGTIVTEHK